MTCPFLTIIQNLFPQHGPAESKLDLILSNQEKLMSTFDELKAILDANAALVGKVKADVESLHAKLDAIPAAGMTPDQQAALDAATAQAGAIRDALAGVDGLTADAAAVPAPAPDA